jgi:hypothetical protein
VIPAQLATQVIKVPSVLLVWPDYRATTAQLVQQEQTVPAVHKVREAIRVQPAQPVFKALLAHKVQEAIRVPLAMTEIRAQQVELAQSAMAVISVLWVWMEQRVELARLVLVVHLVPLASLVILAPPVLRAQLVHVDLRVLRVIRVQLVALVL